MDFAVITDLFSQSWVTPESAMAELFPDLMPELHPHYTQSSEWSYDYMTLLENLRQRGDEWERLIDSMPAWCAYVVAFKESRDVRKRKDEWGTGMVHAYWAEALVLFMTDRIIPFEIDESLVNTELCELSLQQKVMLRDHLRNSYEMEVMGPPPGYSMCSSSSSGPGSSSKERKVFPKYWAPRAVYCGYLKLPIRPKAHLNAVLGKGSAK